MFTRIWIVAFVGVAIVGLVLHATSLFFLAIAVFLIALCARLWERYCLVGVEYRRSLTSDRAFFGDSIDLDVEIVNRKALPLAWLEIEDELPRRLPPRHGRVQPSFKSDRSYLVNVVALRPFERVRRRFTIPCVERGEHTVGPIRVRSGDLFGFFRRQEDRPVSARFLVYPKVVPIGQLGLPPRQPLGDVRRPSWIFEDPAWIAGVREYTSRDGMRRIHWKASARSERLQVKVFDATTDHQIALFVNLHTAGPSWWWMAFDEVALEMIAVTAASLARWASQEKLPVGLYVNGHPRDQQTPIALPPTADPAQYPRILEALARMQPFAKAPIEQFLADQSTRLPFGTTVAVIAARLTDGLLEAGRQARRRGHSPVLIVVGERPGIAGADDVPIRFVPGAEIWRDLTTISGEAALLTSLQGRG